MRPGDRTTALLLCCAGLIGLGATPVAAQGWQLLLPAPPVPPATVHVPEPGGSVLAIDGASVVRIAGAARRRLEATGAPLEAPHQLAPSPGGGTFVATHNGVYLAHPAVATLDRCDYGPGGPAGPVVGLVADRIDRLWVVTAEQVHVVHPGLGFHRQHTGADGLPAPPFVALHRSDAGELLLYTKQGAYGYRPDPAPPRLHAAAIASRSPPFTVQLDCRSEGHGAVHHCYRLRSHHLLRPADGPIDLRRPGRHELLVYAVDRDLDVSEPLVVHVDAGFAGGFDARVAGGLGAVLGAILGAICWRAARRRGRSRRRAALDALLAWLVAAQLGMAMTGVGRTYPFIGFTMYGEVYRENDVLFTPELLAIAADGRRAAVAGSLGFATDGVWRHLASLLYASPEEQRQFVTDLGSDVHTLELRIRRCRLTGDGPRDVAPLVLARLTRGNGR